MIPPTVSVIVPLFNLGQYLDEAIDSVVAQTFQDFEILVVDDGSTDPATVHLIETYERPKTTVFRTANRGLAAARNYLIERARGEYLCALDADDKLHPRFLEVTVAVLDRDPSLAFASPRLETFGEASYVWPATDRCDLAMLLCDDTVITPALVRRAAVVAVGGYDERMPAPGDEDWDLWITLVEAGYRGVILPEVLFSYRRRPGSMAIACTTGQTHLDLMAYMVRKHHSSYEAHLPEVLEWKEARIEELRSRVSQLVQESPVAPSRPDTHPATLELEVRRLAEEVSALRAEYGRALNEVKALRSSVSWRLTAPLRTLYDWLRNS